MATHSRISAWRIPWTEEPDWLQSKGLHRVGHDYSDLAAAAANHHHFYENKIFGENVFELDQKHLLRKIF